MSELVYPEGSALAVWQHNELTCSIVRHGSGHLCGYVRFPKRLLRERDYDGIVTYVPVHGGVTYSREDNAALTSQEGTE